MSQGRAAVNSPGSQRKREPWRQDRRVRPVELLFLTVPLAASLLGTLRI